MDQRDQHGGVICVQPWQTPSLLSLLCALSVPTQCTNQVAQVCSPACGKLLEGPAECYCDTGPNLAEEMEEQLEAKAEQCSLWGISSPHSVLQSLLQGPNRTLLPPGLKL